MVRDRKTTKNDRICSNRNADDKMSRPVRLVLSQTSLLLMDTAGGRFELN